MDPIAIFLVFGLYTSLLFIIAWITSRKAGNKAYFIGNKTSPWYVVAYGMIGASLSGVTFISVPGDVSNSYFSYMLIVLGFLVGYAVIAEILLPLYYRLNLTSIYSYLRDRFGPNSHKTGAFFFLLSRSIGASFRVYLVVAVLQLFVFDGWNIPFIVTVLGFMGLIILYSFKGGIKTIVWTDTLQTTFMLTSVVVMLYLIGSSLELSFGQLVRSAIESEYAKMFFFDWTDRRFFLKQFFSGVFIAIVMTGLDQDMMQKNLSCRTLPDAKKNIYLMSWLLVPVNLLFLFLGLSLYIFAAAKGITLTGSTDQLFPMIAFSYLGATAGMFFLIGLVAASYSSADGTITALTTSFCVDILGFDRKQHLTERSKIRKRYLVHVLMALVLIFLILAFRAIGDQSVIQKLFTIAGYTYGPLLGIFTFGLFTKHSLKDRWVPVVALASPILSFVLNSYSEQLLGGYRFGFELLIVNGMLTFMGLWLIRNKKH